MKSMKNIEPASYWLVRISLRRPTAKRLSKNGQLFLQKGLICHQKQDNTIDWSFEEIFKNLLLQVSVLTSKGSVP